MELVERPFTSDQYESHPGLRPAPEETQERACRTAERGVRACVFR